VNLVMLIPIITELLQAAGTTYATFAANQGKDLDPEVLAMIKAGYDKRIADREAEQDRLNGINGD